MMLNDNTVGWGLVGTGEVVLKKWAPSLRQASGNRAVGVFDPDPARADQAARQLGTRCFDSYPQMLQEAAIDIVYVATPHHLHAELTLAALRAGKHVLCEKPMGVSAAEGRDMVRMAKECGRELFVDYYRRFHPIVQTARQWLAEDAIGQLTYIEYRSTYPMNWDEPWGAAWMWDRRMAGGGPIMNIGVHRLDIMHYLAGPVRRVAAQVDYLAEDRVEKWICGALTFDNGAGGVLVQHGDTAPPCDVLVFHGRRGVLTIEPFDKGLGLVAGQERRQESFSPPDPLHLGVLEHVGQVLRGRARNEIVSGREGLRTIELVSAIYDSAQHGRAIELDAAAVPVAG